MPRPLVITTAVAVLAIGYVGTAEQGFNLAGTIASTSTTDVVTPDGSTLSVEPSDTTAG